MTDDLTQDIESTLRRSGVTYDVFATLADVCRTTIYFWRKNRRNPHRRTMAPVVKALHAINAAVDTGDLPLPGTVTTPDEKLSRTAAICKKHGL